VNSHAGSLTLEATPSSSLVGRVTVVNLAVLLFILLAIPILFYYRQHIRNWPSELLSAALFTLGFMHLMTIPILAYFLFGMHEYRMWLLLGPVPFKLLGSGPLLVWLGAYLILTGYGFVALSLKWRSRATSGEEKKVE
jgi:hypothetical protein